jgi:uncharacterized protein
MNTTPVTPSAPEQGGDPSMEDILASIRRILNEEEPTQGAPGVLELTPAMRVEPGPAPAAPAPATPRPMPAPVPPIVMPAPVPPIVLPAKAPEAVRETPPVPPPAPAAPPQVAPPPVAEPSSPPQFAAPPPPAPPHPAPAPAEQPPPEPPAEAKPPAAEVPSLVAPAAAAAAAASMGELVRRLSGSQQTQVTRGGPTIEDLVREEIRGLLKAWLDENLPRVVERLVRAEIERVVSRHVG